MRRMMSRLVKAIQPRNAKGSRSFLKFFSLCMLIILAFGLFRLFYFSEAVKKRSASKLIGPSYTQNAGESEIPITSAESEIRVIRHLGPKISSCFKPPLGNIIEGFRKADKGEECLPEECSANSTRCRNTFGQCHQDMCAISRFGNLPGYYLDLGANHPFEYSNTYALDRYYNWSGLCIEAQEDLGMLFLSHRTCTLAQTLISDEETTLEFLKDRGLPGLSGVVGYDNTRKNGKIVGKFAGLSNDRMLERKQTFKLEDVLDKAGAPSTIDYFSFDVEGMELKILKGFDFSRYGFRYMTVERPGRELHMLLVDRGFCVLSNGCSFTDIWYQNRTLSKVSNAATKEWCNELALPGYINTKDVCK